MLVARTHSPKQETFSEPFLMLMDIPHGSQVYHQGRLPTQHDGEAHNNIAQTLD